MTKNKLLQAVKGLTLAAGMAVGIFALGQTDVLADTLTNLRMYGSIRRLCRNVQVR